MAEITGAEYSAWKTSTFGEPYHIWHDGLSVEAVTSLTGDARSHAVGMLIFGVQSGDGDAASALSAMGETSALPDLRTALAAAAGGNKVSIAQAINHLSGGQDVSAMAKTLMSVLEVQNQHWSTRMDAAMGLRAYGDEESEEALLRAVEKDDHFLVRLHSCDSLLVRWKVEKSSVQEHEEIRKLIYNPGREDPHKGKAERRREAVRLLLELKK